MKKTILFSLLLTLGIASLACAFEYNYLEPAAFRQWLETGKKASIIDIQPTAEFRKQHFRGAIETNAFPAKTAEERARLDKALPQLMKSTDPVVLICPRGGSGAKGAYDHLKSKGITENRLYILKNGMQGWPHKELTVADN